MPRNMCKTVTRKTGWNFLKIGDDFVDMFCREMKCSESQIINRIEFEYIN